MTAVYTPGAGGALRGVTSALSSLPVCPCSRYDAAGPVVRIEEPARPCLAALASSDGPWLTCDAGHCYRATAEELQDLAGGLAAAARRAPKARREGGSRRRTKDRRPAVGELADLRACPGCGTGASWCAVDVEHGGCFCSAPRLESLGPLE